MFYMVYKPLPLQQQVSWKKGKASRALTLDGVATTRGGLEGRAVFVTVIVVGKSCRTPWFIFILKQNSGPPQSENNRVFRTASTCSVSR